MNTRQLLCTLTLAVTGAGFGAAQAADAAAATAPQATPSATPAAASPSVPTPAATQAVKPLHPAAHHHRAARHAVNSRSADFMHQRVALARAAEQQHWISMAQQHHRLDGAQAAVLSHSVNALTWDQMTLTHRGHETVPEALAMSHRQDLLDWTIHTGHTDYVPQRISAWS